MSARWQDPSRPSHSQARRLTGQGLLGRDGDFNAGEASEPYLALFGELEAQIAGG
jgi:hypothetical protein